MTTRAVDRLLQIFLGLSLCLAGAGAAFGLFFLAQDAGQSGEFLDGVGALVDLVILVLVGVPGTLAAVALHRSLVGRAEAPLWALAAGALGTATVLLLAFVHHPFAVALVPPVLVSVAALGARRPVRRSGP